MSSLRKHRHRRKWSPQGVAWNDTNLGANRIPGSVGLLVQLYRFLIKETGVQNEHAWERLLNDYIKRFAKENPDRSANAERGNIRKALNRSVMSWKSFLRALVLLKFAKVEIIVTGTLENGKTVTVKSQVVDLSGPTVPYEDDQEPDIDEPEYPRIASKKN